VSNSIEKAQRKVEGRNFDIRKQLLEFDDVANDQRQVIYQQRRDLLETETVADILDAIRFDVVNTVISGFVPPQSLQEQWDIPGLQAQLEAEFGVPLPLEQWLKDDEKLGEEGFREKIYAELTRHYDEKCDAVKAMGINMRQIEKDIMLQVLDQQWKEHLASMDYLRQGIHLRAYAQKNPKQEYKRESFSMFQNLLENIKYEVVRFLSRVQITRSNELEALEKKRREQQEKLRLQHAQLNAMGEIPAVESDSPQGKTFVREDRKVGRNEPCPCGSGKKYKQCHGKLG